MRADDAARDGDGVRILVIGAGAMGSLIAARLAVAGVEVTLFGRPSPHLAAIQHAGLRLEERDTTHRQVPLRVATDPAAAATATHALVLVKAWATRDALRPLRCYLPPDSLVLTLQNGLGNREAIQDELPAHDIVAGVTSQAALRPRPGAVRHTGDGPTLIGRGSAVVDDRPRQVAAILTGAGIQTAAVADIDHWIWRKLAVNAAINGPTALTGRANGAVADDPRLRAAAGVLAGEVAAVARALRFDLARIEETVVDVARTSALNRSSMLQDLDAGRRTEVAAIYDAVIEAGAQGGIDTPALRLMAALIHAREQPGKDGTE
ncbi:MAG: 2-dehydropantoate 2-reductase [Chloroflexota bacterium]|nr:2-dehydropantoate 2-reductase [Chloroflexota bacterium]